MVKAYNVVTVIYDNVITVNISVQLPILQGNIFSPLEITLNVWSNDAKILCFPSCQTSSDIFSRSVLCLNWKF